MSNIPTKDYSTKGGAKIVLREYITYGDRQEIADVYRDEKANAIDQIHKADKLGVEKTIVSINGETENLYKVFCALPLPDANELSPIIKAIIDPKADPKAEPKP